MAWRHQHHYDVTIVIILNIIAKVCGNVQELLGAEARAQQGLASIPESSKISAYQAWLGFYNSYRKALHWSPEQLVHQANYFSQTIGQLPCHHCILFDPSACLETYQSKVLLVTSQSYRDSSSDPSAGVDTCPSKVMLVTSQVHQDSPLIPPLVLTLRPAKQC